MIYLGEINRQTLGCITEITAPENGNIEIHFRKDFNVLLTLSCLAIQIESGEHINMIDLFSGSGLFAEDILSAKKSGSIRLLTPQARKGCFAIISFVEGGERRRERTFKIQ